MQALLHEICFDKTIKLLKPISLLMALPLTNFDMEKF